MRIVGGKFAGRPLVSPQTQAIRPTSDRTRESLFNILNNVSTDYFTNRRVLDLFAGTGALGLEAISRGASAAVHVETTVEGRALLQKNIEALSLQGIARILRRDATHLGNIGTMAPFDLIFADPPYNQGLGERAFLSALMGGWLKDQALLVLEEAVDAIVRLPAVFDLYDKRTYGRTVITLYKLNFDEIDKGSWRD